MQYQLKTEDSKKVPPIKRPTFNVKKEKDPFGLNSYVHVDANNEWQAFLSLTKK